MKDEWTRSRLHLLGIGLALLLLAAFLVATHHEESSNQGLESASQKYAGKGLVAHDATPLISRRRSHVQSRDPRTVVLTADGVLATVNGVAIKTPDLAPEMIGQAERRLPRSLFRERLRRAIDAELVFQAATRRGIGLTAAQKRRLEMRERRPDTAVASLASEGVSWHSLRPDAQSFGKRMTKAMMLRQNLVSATTGLSPSPDPGRQKAYEEGLENLLSRLRRDARVSSATGPAD